MITVTVEPDVELVRVDGRLAGDGVGELLRLLDSVTAPVRLLLHDLRGADAAGLTVLRQLSDQGTAIEGLSTYLQLLLAGQASAEPPESDAHARSQPPVRSTDT